MKRWYNIVDSGANTAQISLFDEIGTWGITSKEFLEDFAAIKDKDEIHVFINSPGGDVMDGMAIYNILSSVREKVTVEVFGIAASIASVIALAGKELVMDEGSYYVIHNPFTFAMGDADQLRKDADVLDKIKNEIVNIYASRTEIAADEINKMMDDETWLTSDEAVAKGFATSINRQVKAAALIRGLDSFTKVPKALIREPVTFKDKTVREVEDALRDAGLSRSEAKEAASKIAKPEPEEPRAEVIEERDAPQPNESIEFLNYLKTII